MAAFLPMFAGMMSGQRDYQEFIQEKQQRDQLMQQRSQQMQFDQLRQQAMQAEMARQAQEEQRGKDVARGTLSLYGQPPAPGQSSQPMQIPGQMPPGQGAMPPQGAQGPQGSPQAPPQGAPQGAPQGPPQGPPPIPPYRSMNAAPPQQGPGAIPEPPKYDWETAIKKIQAQGVTDPKAIVEVLEKHQSRLDTEARAKLAQVKEMQLEEDRRARMDETGRHNREMESSTKERADKARDFSKHPAGSAGGGSIPAPGGKGTVPAGIEAATWDFLIKNAQPPKRGQTYQQVMGNVEKIAKDNGMSVQELMSASADVKTKLAAKRQFEVRAQNMSRAENVLNREIPNFEQAVEKVNTSTIPAMAKLELAARRQMGDPTVTQMDQAAEVIFREFEGIVTGNPGTLNVQDVVNAHDSYRAAQTPQQAKAAIAGMRRIIDNAKKGLDDTRTEIMGDINRSLGRGGKSDKVDHPAEIADLLKKYGG